MSKLGDDLIEAFVEATANLRSEVESESYEVPPNTWHYRVLRYTDGTLALHEVYCDEEGRLIGYTARPISFAVDADDDEGHDGLVQSLRMALRDAVERPVLDVTDLPEV